MQDRYRTKKELIDELTRIRQEVASLRGSRASFGTEGDIFRAIGDSVQAGIYIIQDDRTVFTNSYISLYSGYSQEELAELSLFKDTVYPEDQDHVRECGIRMLKGLDQTPYEYRIVTKSGDIRWLMEKVTSIRYGGRRAILGNTMDVTDRKHVEAELMSIKSGLIARIQERNRRLLSANKSLEREIIERREAEEALRQAERKYYEIYANAVEGIYQSTKEGRFIVANPAFARMHGYDSPEELIASVTDIGRQLYVNPADRAAWIAVVEKSGTARHEFQIRRKDGSIGWASSNVRAIRDDEGRIAYFEGITRDITEQKQAEEALRRSEEKYRELVENANSIILRMDKEGRITFFNEYAQAFFGYGPDEIIGRKAVGTIVPERETTGRDLVQLFEDMGTHPHRYLNNINENILRTGERVWIAWTNKPVWDENGELHEILCIGNDITYQRQAEEALQESEQRLFNIIQGSPTPTYVIDRDHAVVYWNRALEEMTGIKAGEIIGTSRHWQAFYDEKRPCMADFLVDNETDRLAEWYAGRCRVSPFLQEAFEGTDFFPALGNNGRWLHFTAAAIRDISGELIGAMETLEDITERKLSEQAVAESEEIFRALAENSLDVIMRFDDRARHLYANPTVEKYVGIAAADFIGKTHREMGFAGDLCDKWEEAIHGVFATGKPGRLEFQHPPGMWMDWLLVPEFDREGGVKAVLTSARDMTERKKMAETLQETKDRLDEAQRIGHIGSWEWDIPLNRIWYSDELYRIYEMDPRSSHSLEAFLLNVHPEDVNFVRDTLTDAAGSRDPFDIEFRVVLPSQAEKILKTHGSVFMNGSGEAVRMAGVTQDITREKIMERQLIHREKLASLGLLIAGIAHEINNPNNFIVFNIPILRDYLMEMMPIMEAYMQVHPDRQWFGMSFEEFRDDVFRLIDNLDHGASRINATVSHLTDFSRKKLKEKRRTSIPEVMEKAVAICRSQIQKSVHSFDTDFQTDLPEIMTDPEALEQIIVNLLINASHAMDKEDSKILLRVSRGRRWRERIIIEVIDNGAGIDPRIRDHLFDPFYSTKQDGKGLGLGLYIVTNLIEGLGGAIDVESEPGVGSTFRVTLSDMEERKKH
jgi:PAS domain S-box-containing protein